MSNSTKSADRTTIEDHDDARVAAAHKYIEQLHVFYVHAAVAAAGVITIFAVNLLTNLSAGIAGEWSAWWSAWAFLGWGLGLAVHGLVVRLARPAFETSSWKEQQLNKLLTH